MVCGIRLARSSSSPKALKLNPRRRYYYSWTSLERSLPRLKLSGTDTPASPLHLGSGVAARASAAQTALEAAVFAAVFAAVAAPLLNLLLSLQFEQLTLYNLYSSCICTCCSNHLSRFAFWGSNRLVKFAFYCQAQYLHFLTCRWETPTRRPGTPSIPRAQSFRRSLCFLFSCSSWSSPK
jgi:hypothetical protein